MSEQTVNWEDEKYRIILQRNRLKVQFACILQWLGLLEDGTNLQPYFKAHKCSRIAIYGAAEIGRMLLKEIERDNVIKVPYFLDRYAERQREKWGIPVYLPEEFSGLPDVDMVVVTAILSFKTVESILLRMKPEIPVVSLETIIYARKDEVWHDGK